MKQTSRPNTSDPNEKSCCQIYNNFLPLIDKV
jgi:hypothetical protein